MSDNEENSVAMNEGGDEGGDGEAPAVDTSNLTAAEKKKLKEKEKKLKQKAKAKEAKKGEKSGAAGGDKPKKKGPNVAIIKEALKKKQEEEERRKREEEEEEQRLQELEKQREEKERLEKEKREKKKQKEKERIARLKKEGKYLTPAQKENQRRHLEMLNAQGIVLPVKAQEGDGEAPKKKKPIYTNKKKPKPKPQDEADGAEVKESPSEEPKEEEEKKDGDEEEAEDEEEEDDGDWENDWETIEPEGDGKKKKDIYSAGEVDGESEESDAEDGGSASSDNEASGSEEVPMDAREKIKARIQKRVEEAKAKRSRDNLRSPVICVLGHVDTGKTSLLDKILMNQTRKCTITMRLLCPLLNSHRFFLLPNFFAQEILHSKNDKRTSVQSGEAGGITQQIGATAVPADAILKATKMIKSLKPGKLKIPGFLIIDTPGHESFSNLRSRGSSLCDIAILVVDLMHGLEPQTIESINMLKKRKTPFVVALNKIDRIYQWESDASKDAKSLLEGQKANCRIEFQDKLNKVISDFAGQSLNVALEWENTDHDEYISLIPTSAWTGEGMGDLLAYLALYAQNSLADRVAYTEALECTVLEVKETKGIGVAIDVILVNGTLHYGDTIVVAGSEGPIVTQIRGLMLPQPMKELRVKTPFENFKEVKGAQGLKIQAKDLEKALAGLPLLVVEKDDEEEYLREETAASLHEALTSIKLKDRGVYVQASTLGSLEALLSFLKDQKIAYCGINIGPVHKKDVVKASAMLEHDKEMAVILAFDVKVEREAQLLADEVGVRIFTADIIYHLQDAFLQHRAEVKRKAKEAHAHLAIFPAKLKILPSCIFNSRNPIVMGVRVESGILRIGTPIVALADAEKPFLGSISSIEVNNKPTNDVRAGAEVCIKIENTTGDAPKMYDRHFTKDHFLVSRITRDSIEICKEHFRDELTKADWHLVVELKKALGVL